MFERALNEKVTLRQGEREKIITKAAAGIEQLVNQFAKGDRHARRDLLAPTDELTTVAVASLLGRPPLTAANEEATLEG